MKDILAAWTAVKVHWETDTMDHYYHDIVWPINEHLDGGGDDPNTISPVGNMNTNNCNVAVPEENGKDNNRREVDDAIDVIMKSATVQTTQIDQDRCADMTN